MACADETVPRVAALPSRTSFTYGVNKVPMIPSPTAVIRLKTSSTLSTRERRTVDAPSRHSTAARRTAAAAPVAASSATSRGGLVGVRISCTSSAASRNDAASTTTTAPSPPVAATTPPTAPPTSRATWPTCPFRAFAVSRPSPGTISGSIAESAVATNTSSTALAASTA